MDNVTAFCLGAITILAGIGFYFSFPELFRKGKNNVEKD